MIISENMGLEDFASELGEFGALRKMHRKMHKAMKVKTMPHAKKKADKKAKKRKGGGAESPEAAEIDQVAVNPGDEAAYDPGYSEPLPGSDSGDEGNYNPGSSGEEALGPAAPGSDMEVDPYAPADGSGDEGDDDGGEDEGGGETEERSTRSAPAPLPMAPSVAPVSMGPSIAPTSMNEGLPMWVWITGSALLAGGGIWWYLKKSGKI